MKNALRREEQILHEVLQNGEVSVDDLITTLGVSAASVRRDLTGLQRKGLIRRTHGGAVTVERLLYEPFRYDSLFQRHVQHYEKEKRRIGLAAAALIQEKETVILTAGTTTTQVARSIRHRKNIRVVTNAVNIAMELSGRRDLKVVVTGGVLQYGWFSLIGHAAVDSIQDLYADRIFVGACGVCHERGVTLLEPDEAATFRAMIRQSRQKVLVADSSKLGVTTAAVVCPVSEIDILITDAGATDEAISPFRATGIDVRRV
ncbi:MAG: DeoR/GlpR family DNA-binding transcription regulator [Terriglobia bacterium]